MISAVSHTIGRLEADVKVDKVLESIVDRLGTMPNGLAPLNVKCQSLAPLLIMNAGIKVNPLR